LKSGYLKILKTQKGIPMKENNSKQYDSFSKEYSSIAQIDPSKQFVQYPSALELLGGIKGKTVLDVGCGDGIFSRQLAICGARITGFDISEKQIRKAISKEKKNPMGIKYTVAMPETFQSKKKFDKAVSVLVLMYAKNRKHLERFFISAYNHLKLDSKFVSIIFNPSFKRFDQVLYNRRFSKMGDGTMQVEFFKDNHEKTFTAQFSEFSIQDYEEAAEKAGFRKVCWKKLEIEEEGKRKLGKDFWRGYEEDCPYIGLVVKK
jgi:toxoflavin synthase